MTMKFLHRHGGDAALCFMFNKAPLIGGTLISILTSPQVISPNTTETWMGRCNPSPLNRSTHSTIMWPTASAKNWYTTELSSL